MIDLTIVRPINGQVVVLDDAKEEKKGALYIPQTAEEARLVRGTVMAESPFLLENGEYKPTGLAAGNAVVYSNHAGAGNTHEADGRIYRIIRWNEILGVEE